MTEKIIEELRKLAATEEVKEHYDESGNYLGATVTYANPLHQMLKTVYHPYIPLQMYRADGTIGPVSPVKFKDRYS